MNWKNTNLMRFAIWSINSLNNKDQETLVTEIVYEECKYMFSHILAVRLNIGNQDINVPSIYVPVDNKPKVDRQLFNFGISFRRQ